MYLRSKESHIEALKSFYDLLAPGGELVIEFRERTQNWDPEQMEEWCEKLGIKVENVKNEAVEPESSDEPTPFPNKEENLFIIRDREKGDGFYFYFVPPIYHPAFEGLNLELDQLGRPARFVDDLGNVKFWAKIEPNGEVESFVDEDGVEYHGFSRIYLDETGEVHDRSRSAYG